MTFVVPPKFSSQCCQFLAACDVFIIGHGSKGLTTIRRCLLSIDVKEKGQKGQCGDENSDKFGRGKHVLYPFPILLTSGMCFLRQFLRCLGKVV